MTTEEHISKFDEIRQRVIIQFFGNVKIKDIPPKRTILTPLDIKKYQNKRKQDDVNNHISVICKDFFETQRQQRDNGGYLIRRIKDIPSEIPPTIK